MCAATSARAKPGFLDFQRWKGRLAIIDMLIIAVGLSSLILGRADVVLLFVFVGIFPYLHFTRRKSLQSHVLVALALALAWMLIAGDQYGYERGFFAFMGINLFTLLAWTLGLFGVYLIYSHHEHRLQTHGFVPKLAFFAAIYWPLLIGVESIAHHLLGFINVSTAMFPGLPFCECIHAPGWMQFSYLVLGPLYFTLCYLLRLENPHVR